MNRMIGLAALAIAGVMGGGIAPIGPGMSGSGRGSRSEEPRRVAYNPTMKRTKKVVEPSTAEPLYDVQALHAANRKANKASGKSKSRAKCKGGK